ncbi:TIR domain-containing protein [Pseudoglutamicibacter cumminsii]|uniref:TIR domain-containing protein n=1 Tax=Pseudoglutamicibacter cumminsii TaxID=156979 RepID=UPI00255460DB|nr:TIR domain-containing protein [Pseudoglutamicibacter cumminsii]MDZ3744528.1 TIR domain-containing protein [Pseudoglutamicibacter cumminsii]
MAVFYSFHYEKDNWRVQQVRNIHTIDNTGSVASQEWESVRRETDREIERWIEEQMAYKRAVVVLIGTETASRKWVQYEIERAWDLKKPLLGIRIHGLKDSNGYTAFPGQDPFKKLGYPQIPVYDPSGSTSADKYAEIKNNLKTWVANGYKRP